MTDKRYPRPHDRQIVYLKKVVTGPNIEVGDYTIYNDFVHDPREFETNNVLYHYPINGDKLKIGKFCSIACGAKFCLQAGTMRCGRCPPTRLPSSLMNGALMQKTSAAHGTTRAIS